MTGLETAFYIIGIVFMSLMLLLMVVGVVAILVIRSKVVALHKSVDQKLNVFHDWTGRGEAVLGAIKKVAKK
jgi:hypothetical protein